MLAAIILAAGQSHRMGTPKALLTHSGRPFLEHLLAVTRHPRIGVTRVVLGAGEEEIRTKIKLDAATVVVNPDWRQGQLSSLQAALRSLAEGLTEGALLCLVDHPLITAHLVGSLIQSFDQAPQKIILPTYQGRRGHPVIFPSRFYGELLSAPAAVGARQVVWACAAEVVEVPTTEEGVVLNLNDPETFRRAVGPT